MPDDIRSRIDRAAERYEAARGSLLRADTRVTRLHIGVYLLDAGTFPPERLPAGEAHRGEVPDRYQGTLAPRDGFPVPEPPL